jgi:hypothetical protein
MNTGTGGVMIGLVAIITLIIEHVAPWKEIDRLILAAGESPWLWGTAKGQVE